LSRIFYFFSHFPFSDKTLLQKVFQLAHDESPAKYFSAKILMMQVVRLLPDPTVTVPIQKRQLAS
jgi:hypothetical protein